MRHIYPCIAAALLACAGTAQATEHTVFQKNKKFSVETLKAKVGDSVQFRNDDTFFHNVFSLSDAQPFDLGSYGQGQTKQVTFSKPGVFEIECAIHPEMKLKIEVVK